VDSDKEKIKLDLERELVIEKITRWLQEEGHQIELGRHPESYDFGIVKMYEKKLMRKETLKKTNLVSMLSTLTSVKVHVIKF
jgi:hypothetical protein